MRQAFSNSFSRVAMLLILASAGLCAWFIVGDVTAPATGASGRVATHAPGVRLPTGREPRYSSGAEKKEFFDQAYYAVGDARQETGARSAVSPHHLAAAPEIARVFTAIGGPGARTVVLISPNHFHKGKARAVVSEGSWDTPYGRVESDLGSVDRLLAASPLLRKEETAFGGEHGVAALMPFVARSFPGARVVAILLDDSLPAKDAIGLGRAIAATLPFTVVASVDMSHYLPSYIADAHDEATLAALAVGNTEFADLEVDSVPTLRALLASNEARETQDWHFLYHGSTLKTGLATKPWDNTSHITGWFSEGGAPAGVAKRPVVTYYLPSGPLLDARQALPMSTSAGYLAEGVLRAWDGAVVIDDAALADLRLGRARLPKRVTVDGESVRVDWLLQLKPQEIRALAVPMHEVGGGLAPYSDEEARAVFESLGIPEGSFSEPRS